MKVSFLVALAVTPALAVTGVRAANVPAPHILLADRSASGTGKIKHVIMILQENRSFDSYFGTFPGAHGIPKGFCYPDPKSGQCVVPAPNHNDQNNNGPHNSLAFAPDMDSGKQDGFIATAEAKGYPVAEADSLVDYHPQSDIPNYWSYAQHYVLADRFYEAVSSWSLPAHLFDVSGWAATCTLAKNPMSCTGELQPFPITQNRPTPFAWTDLTYLLDHHGVSWGYYLDNGERSTTNPNGVLPIWDPLSGFPDVSQDGQTGNIQNLTSFYTHAAAGTLPAVSWIAPDPQDSEHPPALISTGQAYVTRIVNAVMQSPDWGSSAIFLSWDDWGGFADYSRPYSVDSLGYGFRTPLIIISPWVNAGTIDDQILSSDAELKFIEDIFLGGQRLNPATDGRPDSRPSVRENLVPGDLLHDFNFSQSPRPADILNPCPPTTLLPTPKAGCTGKVKLTGDWND
jgi:phospholipase C